MIYDFQPCGKPKTESIDNGFLNKRQNYLSCVCTIIPLYKYTRSHRKTTEFGKKEIQRYYSSNLFTIPFMIRNCKTWIKSLGFMDYISQTHPFTLTTLRNTTVLNSYK